MRPVSLRTVCIGALALICGLAAAGFVKSLASPRPTTAVPVAVAAKDLAVDELITEDKIKLLDWPNSIDRPADILTDPKDILGRRALVAIRPDTPLTTVNLSAPGAPALTLEGMIQRGMSAYMVSSQLWAKSSPMNLPNGSIGDLWWMPDDSRISTNHHSKPVALLQNVRFLKQETNPNNSLMALELRPADVELMTMAEKCGQFNFILHSGAARAESIKALVSAQQLKDLIDPPPPPPKAEPKPEPVVIKQMVPPPAKVEPKFSEMIIQNGKSVEVIRFPARETSASAESDLVERGK